MFGLRSRRRPDDPEGHLAAIDRSQAVAEFALDGTILTANGNFLRAMGYTLEEVTNRHHGMFVPEAERDSADYRRFWADLGRGDFKSALFRRIGKGGREVWLQATYTPVIDRSGNPLKVIKIAADVTEAVRESADKRGQVRALQRAQAVVEFDLAGNVLTANENFLRPMGYALADIVGRHQSMFLAGDEFDTPAYREFWAALGRGEFRAAEFRRIGRDGREVWWQATYNPVFAADGAPTKIVKFGTDVTLARLEAANAAGLFAAVHLTQAVIEFGLDGTIITANENFLHALGYTHDEIAGRHHSMFVNKTERFSLEYMAFWDALRAGKFRGGEFRRIRKDGADVWLRAAYNPIFGSDGKPFKVVKFAYDVTMQVAARERLRLANLELERLARHMTRARTVAEQASLAKTRFLAGMSHELRTPLNGILGYAQLLNMDAGLTKTQAERVQSMLGCGMHLLDMITSVLDLSEIEAAGAAPRIETVDIASLAAACLSIVRPAADSRQLLLDVLPVVAPGVPRHLLTDPRRLRQILLNLLSNAVKFTARGSVQLRIGPAPAGEIPGASAGGTRLWFEVVDTGPGIPPERRHLLFEDFERLDADAAGVVEGAGLGLSLAKRFAALLGGDLCHAENPGGGSVFRLDLPLVAPAAVPPAQAAPLANAQPPLASATRLKTDLPILVVDDIAMNRDIAASFIVTAGFNVVCVEGGAEAVAAAAATDFLLVLMDIRMPGMDGLEATRHIRALSGPRARVPIVALTAQVFTEQIEACRLAGMDTHVAKPFTSESLLGAIARGLAASQGGPVFEAPTAAAAAPEHVPPAPAAGAHLPVLDKAALERTAAMLNPAAVTTYLRKIADRIEALQALLRETGGSAAGTGALADEAHALAGSAGMFGFDRLVFVARAFERAVRSDPLQAAPLAAGLNDALAGALAAIHERAELREPQTA